MTNDKTSVTGSDEAHDDLMATLAAARDLNPDMDKTLADQYLARRREEQQRQDQVSPVVRRGWWCGAEWWADQSTRSIRASRTGSDGDGCHHPHARRFKFF
jgi:hypothetical protein